MKFNARYAREYWKGSRLKQVSAWIIQIVAVILAAAVISLFFCRSVVMQEGSMEPTIEAGDQILVNKAAYKIGSPKRGDIIVFRNSDDEKASMHIKRVIGLPQEKIQIKDGKILINGKIYQEEKGFPEISNPGLAEETISLGAGEYFVLGDNRNNSEDSRHMDVGVVKKKNIEGKLWFVISPLDRIGLLKR